MRNLGPDGKPIAGGYGLYRRNCLHCHGVSGAGDGPTAAFLYPIPRDYRKGMFKFTSTPNGARPHRDDLSRTITNGLHGTSMPAFEALMSSDEIEQVIDYVIFLSIRGETELELIELGAISDETDVSALSMDDVAASGRGRFQQVEDGADSGYQSTCPGTPIDAREHPPRPRPVPGSNQGEARLCRLPRGPGARRRPQLREPGGVQQGRLRRQPQRAGGATQAIRRENREVWTQKLDDWGNPLRPANLNRGVYKGGRRPIDIYWRIAKGINGAKMPPGPNDAAVIWDLVNFVLALPYEPELLKDAPAPPAAQRRRWPTVDGPREGPGSRP